MCLTCGCMDAHLEMGENNITYEDLKRAADENGRSVEETLQIFDRRSRRIAASTLRNTRRRRLAPPTAAAAWPQAKNGGDVKT